MRINLKATTLTLATIAALTSFALAGGSTNSAATPENTNGTADAKGAQKPAKKKQADEASTTAVFSLALKITDGYKSAVDAHALDQALKLVDKNGAFKGKVAKVFEPGGLAIVEFDENYKTAMTAVLKSANFTNFPALTSLVGKEVVITGKFIKYRDSVEVVLEKPEQVKIVQ